MMEMRYVAWREDLLQRLNLEAERMQVETSELLEAILQTYADWYIPAEPPLL